MACYIDCFGLNDVVDCPFPVLIYRAAVSGYRVCKQETVLIKAVTLCNTALIVINPLPSRFTVVSISKVIAPKIACRISYPAPGKCRKGR